jgi:hypothetical protein
MAKLFLHTRESSFRAKAQWQLCTQAEEIRFIDDGLPPGLGFEMKLVA